MEKNHKGSSKLDWFQAQALNISSRISKNLDRKVSLRGKKGNWWLVGIIAEKG